MSSGSQHIHNEATDKEGEKPHSILQMPVPWACFLEQCGCKQTGACQPYFHWYRKPPADGCKVMGSHWWYFHPSALGSSISVFSSHSSINQDRCGQFLLVLIHWFLFTENSLVFTLRNNRNSYQISHLICYWIHWSAVWQRIMLLDSWLPISVFNSDCFTLTLHSVE